MRHPIFSNSNGIPVKSPPPTPPRSDHIHVHIWRQPHNQPRIWPHPTYVRGTIYHSYLRREPVWHVVSCFVPQNTPRQTIDRATPPKHCFSSRSFFIFIFYFFKTIELWTRFEYTWRERDRFDEIRNFHFRQTTTLGNQYFSSSFCCFFLFEYVHDHNKHRESRASCPTNNKEKTYTAKQGKQKTDPNKSSRAVTDMTTTREMEFVNVCHVDGWIWGGNWMVMM